VTNADAYKTQDVVAYYSHLTDLQPPEESILNKLLPDLSRMAMLDIGVGGGRTTLHFAKWVKQYIGMDCSEEMVAACQTRFSRYPGHLSFMVADARSMPMFADRTFDLILFSFNGIDYVSHNERLRVLEEVHRVGKSGGFFCFSTHNIQSVSKKFALKHQRSRSLKRFIGKMGRWFLVRFVYNRHLGSTELNEARCATINDGAFRYQFRTHYIRPSAQLEQLTKYFTDVRIYSLADGKEVHQETELHRIDDDWLYYLCVIR